MKEFNVVSQATLSVKSRYILLAGGGILWNTMVVTDTWIDIDTGAGYGRAPMLLRLDDLKAFYV